MIRIPIIGGVYLPDKEKVTIAEQLVKGIAHTRLAHIQQDELDSVVLMAGAMERACCLAIDALQARAEEDPAIKSVLDQMHSELVAADVR